MHLLRHPRNAALLGLIFIVIGIIYFVVPTVAGVNQGTDQGVAKSNILDIVAGTTMLIGLGIAMAIMAYVLVAGTRGE